MSLNGSDYEARRRRFQAAVRGGSSCEPPVESPSRFHAALTLATSEAEVRCLFVNAPPPITLDLCSASEGASPSASADVDQVDEEEDQVEAMVEAHDSDTTAALQGASPSLLTTKHSGDDDAPERHARLDSAMGASPCRDMMEATSSRAPSRSRSPSRRAGERQVSAASAQRSTRAACVQLPNGRTVAYDTTNNMVAECTIADHGGGCFLARSLHRGPRAGQGRPVGLLLAWLNDPSIHEASRTRPGWHRPAFDERAAHRLAFASVPGAGEILRRERLPAHDEGEEPGEVA